MGWRLLPLVGISDLTSFDTVKVLGAFSKRSLLWSLPDDRSSHGLWTWDAFWKLFHVRGRFVSPRQHDNKAQSVVFCFVRPLDYPLFGGGPSPGRLVEGP